MKTFHRFTFVASAMLFAAGQINASVINGDFGSGLSNWTSLGDVGVNGAPSAFLTTASLGDDDAPAGNGTFNFSGTAADLAGVADGLEEFTGLVIGDLDPDFDGGIYAFEGSALKQSFSVNACDVLSFDYNLFTNDTINADFAFLVVNGSRVNIAGAFDAITASENFLFETGAASFQYTFTQTGPATVAFGIVDTGDFAGTSALALSNVSVSAVPEPSSFAMIGGALALGFAVSRRRRA